MKDQQTTHHYNCRRSLLNLSNLYRQIFRWRPVPIFSLEMIDLGFGSFQQGYVVYRLTAIEEPDRADFLNEMKNLEVSLRRAKGEAFLEEFRRDAIVELKPEYDQEYVAESRRRRR